MKKIIALLVAFSMIFTVGATAFAWDEGCSAERTYTTYKGTITVDGDIEDAWDAVAWTPIEIPINQPYPSSNINYYGASEKVKIMYDDTYFYYLLDITGADAISIEDAFEVYIDEGAPLEAGYTNGYQITMNYDPDAKELGLSLSLKYTDEDGNFVKDKNMEDEVDHKVAYKVSEDGKSIVIELAVVKLAPTTSVDGATVAMEFMYEDYGTIEGVECVIEDYRWNVIEMDKDENPTGVTRPNNASGNFGLVTLGGEAPAPEETQDATTDVTPDTNDEVKEPAETSMWLYVGIAVAVLVVVAVVVIVVAKKKA